MEVFEQVSLRVKPHLRPKSRFMLLSVAVWSMWGALSDERTGLSSTAAIISSTCNLLVYLQFHMSAFYMVSCHNSLFTVLHITLVHTVCKYNIRVHITSEH
jgi:hypothetical protein